MMLEEIKVGNYDRLYSETFILANARDVSFYIVDNTPQKLKLTIRLSENPKEQTSLRQDENDKQHLRLVINISPGEKLVSKEFVLVGSYDTDLKPLYMGFYTSSLNETSRLLILNFYTLKHGEDIG